jgi:hypothetical protein
MMLGGEEERWRSQVCSMIQFSIQVSPAWCLAVRTGKEGCVKDGFEKECEAQEVWILKGGVQLRAVLDYCGSGFRNFSKNEQAHMEKIHSDMFVMLITHWFLVNAAWRFRRIFGLRMPSCEVIFHNPKLGPERRLRSLSSTWIFPFFDRIYLDFPPLTSPAFLHCS